ncbi:transcription termination/antitermination protein NusA [Candidatus Saccharibacteria bacterium]|jgi:N utilization substance protein A|nr:transcription termination/antitermination protein NusA [Candidatus Saccharibacteria bacterium]
MEIELKQLVLAIQQIADEKNLEREIVHDIVQQALASAYKRDFGDREQEVEVELNEQTGTVTMMVHKLIVEDAQDPVVEISLKDAQKIKKSATVGEEIIIKEQPTKFGRVAAQTAKQVIFQKLREAEREIILEEYDDKIGSVINGIVTRVESRVIRIDLGKAQGILPMSEQIRNERLTTGQRVKVFLKDVERTGRGPQLILSRANGEFIRYLFSQEVPEMESGAVEIKGVAREAGVRTKLAVNSTVPGVDPVGTFVGGHGTRVQAVSGEIGDEEKIDIIQWDDDLVTYISHALSPTEVKQVVLEEKSHKAIVYVDKDQQSIAIGRGGQNVRLASKLTGWDIDIESDEPKKQTAAPARKKLASKAQLEDSLLKAVENQND